jgi:YfiR/HmsC-like
MLSVLGGCLAVRAATWPLREAQADSSLERAIKATYLWKFAPFVAWPESAFRSPETPLVICVLGDKPVADLLQQAVAGERVESHPIFVRELAAVRPDTDCRILFDAGSNAQSVADALATVRGRPVLTVTDTQEHGGPKGVINFIVENNHVRFEINDAAAAVNGLTISSKLLSLAIVVTPRTEGASDARSA